MSFYRTRLIGERSGMAAITAMLIMMTAMVVVSVMLWRVEIWIRQTENFSSRAQAAEIARAAIDWIGEIALEETRDKEGPGLTESGSGEIPLFPVEGGKLRGNLVDVQGKLNLNNMAQEGEAGQRSVEAFRRLLSFLDLPLELADALADWIDADSDERVPYGAEDYYYLGLDPPYRTANRPLVEINSLRFVKGFDESVIEKLEPYATALPDVTPINVNTSPPEIMAAMFGETLSLEWARYIASIRKNERFESVEQFRERLPLGASVPKDTPLSVVSRFYMVTAEVKYGRARVAYQAIIETGESFKKPRVIWLKET